MKRQSLPIAVLLICLAGIGWWMWQPNPAADVEDAETAANLAGSGNEQFAGLDIDKQKAIWDSEHVTFELETHFGRKLVAGIQDRSTDSLASFFRTDFAGVVPGQSDPSTTKKSSIVETTYSVEVNGAAAVDSERFSQHLMKSIEPVPIGGKGRLRVLKIKRVEEEGPTDSWDLDVLLTLSGMDASGEPTTYTSHGRMQCRFADDDEIKAGRIVKSWRIDSESLRKSQQTLMEEVTSQVRLDRLAIEDNWTNGVNAVRQYRFQAAVEDFDGDGFLDIAAATAEGQQFVLRWDPEPGQYVDVTESLGLPSSISTNNRAYLASWFDFDNDGDPDLLLGESFFRNVEGRRFEPLAENGGAKFAFNPMGCVVADYDADGLLDLYVLYQRERDADAVNNGKPPAWVGDDDTGAANQLWRNLGGGKFEETAKSANATSGKRHSFAATWLHANDDHYPDLYVANDFARNSLLINRGDGTFDDVTDSSDVGDFATSMGVASGDINGDGTPEIYIANMYSKMGRRIIANVSADDYPDGVYEQLVGSCAGNRLYSTTGNVQQYHELSEQLGINAVGWAYAPAFADFDSDGLLDIYATTGFLSFNRTKPDG
ncbi:FG-GAP repeat domain-containing protein [Fuerstiella marisgermanici]|uniref:FG-GAP repeat n=1 Tax=Fuerstiella marisgermanici TaxID=1891926 RepID=A0A1P8WHK5_9PLAN|nr:VCBS repeat-containing protein [Fuerstiella marisgermanici]APZ93517.1 FG-GAP repeat [Fuerstiella marisgermanici]